MKLLAISLLTLAAVFRISEATVVQRDDDPVQSVPAIQAKSIAGLLGGVLDTQLQCPSGFGSCDDGTCCPLGGRCCGFSESVNLLAYSKDPQLQCHNQIYAADVGKCLNNFYPYVRV